MENHAPESGKIKWPERYSPQVAPVHVRNSLKISAPAADVWAWLVRAERWPDWYPNAARVRILRGGGPELALGTEFRWRTFGVGIRSTVREFVPGRRIAWDGRSLGIDVYHAWLIEESADGCRVLTEETQHGAIARLGAWLIPTRMSDFHQIWLENLAANAATGEPR
jgi:uncharacterized protein YndB with AHSA1/START domain